MRVRRRFPYICFDRPVRERPVNNVVEIIVNVNVDKEAVADTMDCLDAITGAADDTMDALTDLARVERAYNDGQVPCIKCGVWSDPEAIAPNGVCETCILEELLEELNAGGPIGCASSPPPPPRSSDPGVGLRTY